MASLPTGGSHGGYDYSFKILLIGDSGVGKSSLLVSFISSQLEDLAPTIGTYYTFLSIFFWFYCILRLLDLSFCYVLLVLAGGYNRYIVELVITFWIYTFISYYCFSNCFSYEQYWKILGSIEVGWHTFTCMLSVYKWLRELIIPNFSDWN